MSAATGVIALSAADNFARTIANQQRRFWGGVMKMRCSCTY